jgi:hypothetical protein
MDFQTIINNAMDARRAKSLSTSEQLTLGELILKLESVKNKDLPVYFDDTEYNPTGIGSWRGSYSELGISYTEDGRYDGYNSDKVTWESEDGDYKSYESVSTDLPIAVTCKRLLEMLLEIKGKTFVGYKGGDFLMGKNTPVWVANYSESSGYKQNEDFDSLGIVDVKEVEGKVILSTDFVPF